MKTLVFAGYNLVFPVLLLLTWPYYVLRMRRRGSVGPRLRERFGSHGSAVRRRLDKLDRPVWIHAVSVGEMNMARALLRELRVARPDIHVVLTTTTVTGCAVGRDMEDDQTVVLYSPLDLPWVVASFFRRVRPRMLLLVEQEIWPNYLRHAARHRVPVWLVNARLSDRSARRMARFSRWLAPLFDGLELICIQRESDRQRFANAGFPPPRLFTIGSLKYEVAPPPGESADRILILRKQLGWAETDPVLFGGSTHDGEEELLLRVFHDLREIVPGLRLFLAPRHMERAGEIMDICLSRGVVASRRSQPPREGAVDVCVLDTTGELQFLYPMATVVFIGKSLRGGGGQNFLEAVQAARPVVVGPDMSNFRGLVEDFVRDGGIRQVADEDGLVWELHDLLTEPDRAWQLAQRGSSLLRDGSGAARRTIDLVLQGLDRADPDNHVTAPPPFASVTPHG